VNANDSKNKEGGLISGLKIIPTSKLIIKPGYIGANIAIGKIKAHRIIK
jgi:hypothetical protein